ncbi:MAG TPA: hypothetical protein VLE43_06170 [Candidatus Saccharimonadia bacterium]|nr:hypothetical protein [Candidatus Saccharimonadia bacterium]
MKTPLLALLAVLTAIVCPSCSLKVSEKNEKQYAGYMNTPLVAKVPVYLYYNDNRQLGHGRGYVLKSYPSYGNKVGENGLIGILPVGHPVTLDNAFRLFNTSLGGAWVEGRTDFKGDGYRVQMSMGTRSDHDADKLTKAFRPVGKTSD